MGWLDKLKEKTVEKAGDISGDVVDSAKGAADKVKESGVGEKLQDGFKRATDGAGSALESGLDALKDVDWKKAGANLKEKLGQGAELSKDGLDKLQDIGQSGLNSEGFQNFLEGAENQLEGAAPVAGVVVDSLKDTVTDPEVMKRIVGGAVLSGGATIPYDIAMEVMKDPAVQGTFSEMLPEGLDIEAIGQLENLQVLEILKDPSMQGVLQEAIQNPNVQVMVKDQLNSFNNKGLENDNSIPTQDITTGQPVLGQ